ncbi:unnamed protein product, partial [Cochlearia groenlandica]
MSNQAYTSALNLSESPFNPTIGSSSSSSPFVISDNDDDDDTDDACSICLEPFSLHDPSTATSCKHEYHLHCIIEWSQRSKECPICWQLFVLKDPSSQELLSAVVKERVMKTRNVSSSSPRSIYQSPSQGYLSEESQFSSSFEEEFSRHFAETSAHRRENQLSSSILFPTIGPLDHISTMVSRVEQQNRNPGSSTTVSPPSSVTNNGSRISPERSASQTQEASSLPEAIKSKLSDASARYKESISKSKQGLKEKILARNNSVKELSKGVQREMNAGIAGVARMIQRLDIASKRFGVSTNSTTTSASSGFNFSYKGKRVVAKSKSNSNEDKTESH